MLVFQQQKQINEPAADVMATDDSGNEGEVLLIVNAVPSASLATGSAEPSNSYSQGGSTINTDTLIVNLNLLFAPPFLACFDSPDNQDDD